MKKHPTIEFIQCIMVAGLIGVLVVLSVLYVHRFVL